MTIESALSQFRTHSVALPSFESAWRGVYPAILFVLLALLVLNPAAYAQITVTPLNNQVLFTAGSSGFSVNAPAGVTWNLEVIRGIDLVGIDSPDISWISVTTPTVQTGPGAVAFTYAENPELFPRTARFFIRIAGDDTIVAEHRFVQEPTDATVILTPSSIDIDGFGGDRTIGVALGPQNPWTATTSQTWIQILTGPTTGPGNLMIRILPNFTGVARVGSVMVGSSSVTITQDFTDATFLLSANSASFPFSGGNGSVGVTVTPSDAPWQAVSNSAFITITNGASHTGTGNVAYTVAVNPDEEPRTGSMTIAGQTFTVNQEANPGIPPGSLSSSVNSLAFVFRPEGNSTLNGSAVITSTGEPHDFTVAINDASWLTVDPSSGTTPTTLNFVADASTLAVGNFSGSVVVTSPTGGSVTIAVTLEVRSRVDPAPLLNAAPRSLYFSRLSGGPIPNPQRISLGNPGSIVSPDLEVQANNWMTVRVTQDEQGPFLLVSIRNVNLLPGTYDSSVRLFSRSLAFADLEIPIRYIVKLAGGSGPAISSGGIVNGATFKAGGAPNTWISIFGSALANTTQLWNPSTVSGSLLPTSLAGTEVFIGGVRAPLSFVSPTQVNALVPGIPDRGWVPLEVRVNNQPSEGGYIYLRDADPAFFVYSPQNGIFPAAQHPDGVAVGPMNLFPGGPPSRPAQGVGTIVLFGTGFGPTDPPVDPATFFQGAAPLLNVPDTKVRVGSLNAQVLFAGQVAPGLYQINVILPGLPPGNFFLNAVIADLATQPGLVILIGQP